MLPFCPCRRCAGVEPEEFEGRAGAHAALPAHRSVVLPVGRFVRRTARAHGCPDTLRIYHAVTARSSLCCIGGPMQHCRRCPYAPFPPATLTLHPAAVEAGAVDSTKHKVLCTDAVVVRGLDASYHTPLPICRSGGGDGGVHQARLRPHHGPVCAARQALRCACVSACKGVAMLTGGWCVSSLEVCCCNACCCCC